MLARAFQRIADSVGPGALPPDRPVSGDLSAAAFTRENLKRFGVGFSLHGQKQLSFEESARLAITGLHLFSFRNYGFKKEWAPLGLSSLLIRLIRQNPQKFGQLLGKRAGFFVKDIGFDAVDFLFHLGPEVEPFLAGLGPHVKELAEGMRDCIVPQFGWSGRNKEEFARGLGKNAGYFAEGLGPKAKYFASHAAHESFADNAASRPFLRGLGQNCKQFAAGLGKNADSVADTLKAEGIDTETIKMLTGKIR